MSEQNKSKKFNYLNFIAGLIIGLLIFGGYYFWQKNQVGDEISEGREEVKTPVSFEIGPYSHLKGASNAPVTFVLFNDFTCPYCQSYMKILDEFMIENPGKVQLVWKHFPLNQDYLTAAIASECADEQGKFWAYASRLYNHADAYYDENYLAWASELGLDADQFSACLSSDKYAAKVQADYYEGIIKGVIGAPATFINGEYVAGEIPKERLAELAQGIEQ